MQSPEDRNPYSPSGPIPPPGYNPRPSGGQSVNGTLILILGILGVFVCGLCAPIAWVMGNGALQTLNSGYGDESQRSMVTIGRILGIVGTVLMAVAAIGFFLVFGLSIFGMTHGPVGPTMPSSTTPPFRSVP